MGHRSVCGICGNEPQATGIIEDLKLAGFANNDISALLPDKTGDRHFGYRRNSKAPEGASTGGLVGGLLGAALGWFLTTGYLQVPELRSLLAAGPAMASLSAAAVLGFTGGLLGALAGMAFPEFEATRFRGKIRQGNILLSVHCPNARMVRRAKQLFRKGGARHISSVTERTPDRGGKSLAMVTHG